MRHAPFLLVLGAAALAACAQPEDEQASHGPVVQKEVAPVSPADAEQLEPGERSLADPAPGSVTAPAGEANPPTLSPGAADDPDAAGGRDQDQGDRERD